MDSDVVVGNFVLGVCILGEVTFLSYSTVSINTTPLLTTMSDLPSPPPYLLEGFFVFGEAVLPFYAPLLLIAFYSEHRGVGVPVSPNLGNIFGGGLIILVGNIGMNGIRASLFTAIEMDLALFVRGFGSKQIFLCFFGLISFRSGVHIDHFRLY